MSCSRAHTVVGVTFTQKRKNDAGEETAKTSLINLVDLAGRLVHDTHLQKNCLLKLFSSFDTLLFPSFPKPF